MILAGFAAILLLVLAVFCAVQAGGSLGPYARILREPTRRIGTLASLGPGAPAEIAGTIRATEAPLIAIDGTRAVAMTTTVRFVSKTYHELVVTEVRAVAAELTDDTGVCSLVLEGVVLIGRTLNVTFEARSFAKQHPALWAKLEAPPDEAVVGVEQTYVPHGEPGLASGAVESDPQRTVEADGFRGPTRGGIRLAGSEARPLFLVGFSDSDARSRLLRPAWLFAALAVGALAAGAALLAVGFALGV